MSTVSRLLRGEYVRSGDAIRQAIAELNYRPAPAARTLRSRVHHAIGVVIPDITNPYFARVVKGIESVTRPTPYSVLIANTDESTEVEEEVLEDLLLRIDGLIYVPTTEQEPGSVPAGRITVPTVLVDRDLPGDYDRVFVDNAGGAALAAEHLIGLGHREIAIISGPLTTRPGRGRHDGFVSALERAGIEIRPEHRVIADFRETGGYEAMLQLLALPSVPTAVFCANNLMTLGALKALQSMRVPVPDCMSVIGFDDIDTAPLLRAPLTVIERSVIDQGVLAARMLFSRLTGEKSKEREEIILPTRLVERSSCAAPPAAPLRAGPPKGDGR